MQDRQKQAGKQAGKQTTRPGVGIAVLVGSTAFGVGSSTLSDTLAHVTHRPQRWGRESREGSRGGLRPSNDRTQETGLETPAVRGFDLVSQAWRLGAGSWEPGAWAAAEKGFGSVLLWCRRAEEKELPSALCAEGWSGLGCTWWMLGRVGSMLVG